MRGGVGAPAALAHAAVEKAEWHTTGPTPLCGGSASIRPFSISWRSLSVGWREEEEPPWPLLNEPGAEDGLLARRESAFGVLVREEVRCGNSVAMEEGVEAAANEKVAALAATVAAAAALLSVLAGALVVLGAAAPPLAVWPIPAPRVSRPHRFAHAAGVEATRAGIPPDPVRRWKPC